MDRFILKWLPSVNHRDNGFFDVVSLGFQHEVSLDSQQNIVCEQNILEQLRTVLRYFVASDDLLIRKL